MGKPHPTAPRHDWNALKLEFMSGSMTPNAFRESKGLGAPWFYRKAKTWLKERTELRNRQTTKTIEKMGNYYEDYVTHTRKLLHSIGNQFAKLLQDTIKVDPATGERTIVPLNPGRLLAMSDAIEKNLKSVRLIEGKSTENKAVNVKTEGDLNERLVGLIEAMQEEGEDTLGDA